MPAHWPSPGAFSFAARRRRTRPEIVAVAVPAAVASWAGSASGAAAPRCPSRNRVVCRITGRSRNRSAAPPGHRRAQPYRMCAGVPNTEAVAHAGYHQQDTLKRATLPLISNGPFTHRFHYSLHSLWAGNYFTAVDWYQVGRNSVNRTASRRTILASLVPLRRLCSDYAARSIAADGVALNNAP